ncbi:hypothetical protein CEXT_217731 [Caerostris extrusa]|uniref:Uncharacterized protein n=1 Tax=Caerostris extrusa TaxID=172846 RepID=A0AAV4S4D8_CAEEX|nr:hypothetical protein CEXT_217731 [Caerostris extrusa]
MHHPGYTYSTCFLLEKGTFILFIEIKARRKRPPGTRKRDVFDSTRNKRISAHPTQEKSASRTRSSGQQQQQTAFTRTTFIANQTDLEDRKRIIHAQGRYPEAAVATRLPDIYSECPHPARNGHRFKVSLSPLSEKYR